MIRQVLIVIVSVTFLLLAPKLWINLGAYTSWITAITNLVMIFFMNMVLKDFSLFFFFLFFNTIFEFIHRLYFFFLFSFFFFFLFFNIIFEFIHLLYFFLLFSS